MKKIIITITALVMMFSFTGCSDAQVASRNLSKAADMFEIDRRVVFYNGITGEYILTLEGRCSVEATNRKLSVTCKTGYDEYKKHYLGISDNVTWFSEQLKSKGVSVYHYRVIFKPQSIIPDVDYRGDINSAINAVVPDSRD